MNFSLVSDSWLFWRLINGGSWPRFLNMMFIYIFFKPEIEKHTNVFEKSDNVF